MESLLMVNFFSLTQLENKVIVVSLFAQLASSLAHRLYLNANKVKWKTCLLN